MIGQEFTLGLSPQRLIKIREKDEKNRAKLTTDFRTALENLLDAAERPTGQSAKIAGFLSSWWNYEEWGGVDLRILWNLDEEHVTDILTVIHGIAHLRRYPDNVGYEGAFRSLIRRRIHLCNG